VLSWPWLQACNIDEVVDAHDKYLNGILAQMMLDEHTLALRTTLDAIFACCQRLVPPLRECDAHVAAKAALLQQVRCAEARLCKSVARYLL
jgi:hypothetical protein